MAVAVTLTNLTLAVVDEEFGALIPGDVAPVVDGFGLRVMDAGNAAVTFPTNGPLAAVGYNVLRFSQRTS